MREELLKLAERCEAATAADRELDAAIAHQHVGFFVRDEGHPLGRKCYDTHGIEVVLPRYTASLDAAMTLVPEGWDKGLQDMGEDGCFAESWRHGWHDDTVLISQAQTPALALCAASLRARAALQETNDGE